MNETELRDRIVAYAASMFDRGLTFGSSGNLSAWTGDGWLMTPTGVRLNELDPARLSKIAPDGQHVGGDPPTKEAFLHTAFYRVRPEARAVVHLHATHSVAVSCLADVDPSDVLPPITAYYVMRVGRLPLVPFFPPGDRRLADAIEPSAKDHRAVLLANHGPIVAAPSLRDAANAIEELEETAKLHLLLRGHATRFLSAEQVQDVQERFPS